MELEEPKPKHGESPWDFSMKEWCKTAFKMKVGQDWKAYTAERDKYLEKEKARIDSALDEIINAEDVIMADEKNEAIFEGPGRGLANFWKNEDYKGDLNDIKEIKLKSNPEPVFRFTPGKVEGSFHEDLIPVILDRLVERVGKQTD